MPNARVGGAVVIADVLNDSKVRVGGTAIIADVLNDSKSRVGGLVLIVDTIPSIEIYPSPSDTLLDSYYSENPAIIIDSLPIVDNSVGQWTNQDDGVVDLFQSIIDESDITYIKSSENPNHDIYKVRLQPFSGIDQDLDHYVIYRINKSGNEFVNVIVSLVQGNTVIYSWEHHNPDINVTEFSQLIPNEIVALITDYLDLYLVFDAYSYGDSIVDDDGNLILDNDLKTIMEAW